VRWGGRDQEFIQVHTHPLGPKSDAKIYRKRYAIALDMSAIPELIFQRFRRDSRHEVWIHCNPLAVRRYLLIRHSPLQLSKLGAQQRRAQAGSAVQAKEIN
jgi:hypothetical protein